MNQRRISIAVLISKPIDDAVQSYVTGKLADMLSRFQF